MKVLVSVALSLIGVPWYVQIPLMIVIDYLLDEYYKRRDRGRKKGE